MNEEKEQITQDQLYQFFTDHNLKLVRLAELTGLSEASINVCFKHSPGTNGQPRVFTRRAVRKINAALEIMAQEIKSCRLDFESNKVKPNQRGKVYAPGLLEPIKTKIGYYFNITKMVEGILGWNYIKKHNVLDSNTGKAYGCITKDDADRLNLELMIVSNMLACCEVVAEQDRYHEPF